MPTENTFAALRECAAVKRRSIPQAPPPWRKTRILTDGPGTTGVHWSLDATGKGRFAGDAAEVISPSVVFRPYKSGLTSIAFQRVPRQVIQAYRPPIRLRPDCAVSLSAVHGGVPYYSVAFLGQLVLVLVAVEFSVRVRKTIGHRQSARQIVPHRFLAKPLSGSLVKGLPVAQDHRWAVLPCRGPFARLQGGHIRDGRFKPDPVSETGGSAPRQLRK